RPTDGRGLDMFKIFTDVNGAGRQLVLAGATGASAKPNFGVVVVATANASGRITIKISRLYPSTLFYITTTAMDDRIDFDINDSLKNYLADPLKIKTPEAPAELVDCENDPDAFTPALINSTLNPVVDSVADNPEAITRQCN